MCPTAGVGTTPRGSRQGMEGVGCWWPPWAARHHPASVSTTEDGAGVSRILAFQAVVWTTQGASPGEPAFGVGAGVVGGSAGLAKGSLWSLAEQPLRSLAAWHPPFLGKWVPHWVSWALQE